MAIREEIALEDKVSGPLGHAAKGADAAARAFDNLRMKAEGSLPNPTMPSAPGGTAGGGAGGVADERYKEEMAGLKEVRRERAIRRLRSAQISIGAQEEKLAHHGSMAMMALLMGEQHTFVGKLANSAAMVEQLGIQFGALGGKSGALGAKMARLGGLAAAVGGAWEIGSTIGEKINQASEYLLEQTEKGFGLGPSMAHFAEGLDKVLNAIMPLYHIATMDARAHKEVLEGNEEFAKALGYRSAAEYGQTREVQKRIEHERQATAIEKKIATQVGAMPVGATTDALFDFEQKIREAATKADRMGMSIDEVTKGAMQLAQSSGASQAERIIAESQLSDALKNQVREITGAAPTSGDLSKSQDYLDNVRYQTAAAELQESERTRSAMESMADGYVKVYGKAAKGADEWSQNVALASQMVQRLTMQGFKATPELLRSAFSEITRLRTSEVKFDFRGSRFDIKQNYAEGFDPDRIAVTFANNLASMAGAAIQSNGGPLGGIR